MAREEDAKKTLKRIKNKDFSNNKKLKKSFSFWKFLKHFFIVLGITFSAFIALAFTDLPYFAYANLGFIEANYEGEPDVIVLLGGEGMPSADGLLRCYVTAEKANIYNHATIAIAIPDNTEDTVVLMSSKLMTEELMLRGISINKIIFENQGTNTHEQADLLFKELDAEQKILIITAPEHMTRAALCFKKAGFKYVGGSPAFEQNIDPEMLVNKSKRNISPSLAFRYNVWSYMQYEIRVAREYTALAYYWLRNWI